MAVFNYDAEGNIVQVPSVTTQYPLYNGTISPLTNAAVQPNVYPQGAPNAFSTTTDRSAGPKTSAFQVNNTVAGIVISTVTNPA
jgi:hypothetical protein